MKKHLNRILMLLLLPLLVLSIYSPASAANGYSPKWCTDPEDKAKCVEFSSADDVKCPGNLIAFFNELSLCGHCVTLDHLRCLIVVFIKLLLLIAFVYAVIRIILAGIQYSSALGNPDKQADAKKALLWSIIGLLVAISAYAIISFIEIALTK